MSPLNRGLILFLFFFIIANVDGQGPPSGSPCTTKKGRAGTCLNIRSCQAAIQDIKNRINPTICSFEGPDPVVCCETQQPVLTTSTARPAPVQPGIPVYDENNRGGQECEALSSDRTPPRNNKKAWNKCIDYQEQLVYPCVKGPALIGEKTRVDRCGHGADQLIVGGVDTTPREFPHMVLLGFGDTPQEAQYMCGGTIISERYILTAGHCTSSREFGDVKYAVIGQYRRSDAIDSSRLHIISSIIKHPDFKPPSKYNDIALLRTENEMVLNQFAVPGCLHTGEPVVDDRASATGWGATQYKGKNADVLQKVTLLKFNVSTCSAQNPPNNRYLKTGFNDRTQMCFGDNTQSKDTCQGDSGGPLQIKHSQIKCMYNIIGVTSYGKPCGFIGDAGIYTRVAPYVAWIESVVWP